MASEIIPTENGILIESDEQSVEFLVVLNSGMSKQGSFILHYLDARHLFIKSESINEVYEALQKRLSKTVWDEEGAAQLAAEKALKGSKK